MRYAVMLLLLLTLLEGGEWELVKEAEGIRVYTRSVDGSAFLEFRGETVVEGSVDALVAVLYDTSNAPAWLWTCSFGMTLEEVRFEENYIFQTYDLPFPVSNRKVVLHSMLSSSEEGVRLDTRESKGYCDKHPLKRCGVVNSYDLMEIERSRGHYLFTAVGENRTKVVWQQHIEPGGTIPGWLANLLVVDIPYHSLSRLRELVQQEQYRSMTMERLRTLWQEQYQNFH